MSKNKMYADTINCSLDKLQKYYHKFDKKDMYVLALDKSVSQHNICIDECFLVLHTYYNLIYHQAEEQQRLEVERHSIRQRRLLHNSVERARARCQSCQCATGAQSMGLSADLGLVSQPCTWSVMRQKLSASSLVRRSQRGSANKYRQRSQRWGQAVRCSDSTLYSSLFHSHQILHMQVYFLPIFQIIYTSFCACVAPLSLCDDVADVACQLFTSIYLKHTSSLQVHSELPWLLTVDCR